MNKDDGGLGFRDMEAFNDALLAKRFWRLIQNKFPLLLNLLRAKYFPHGDIMHATLLPQAQSRVSLGLSWGLGMSSLKGLAG